MVPMPAGLKLGLIEPKAAMAVFAERGLLQPSFRWQDTWQHEHAKAFAVAGVMKIDVLALIRKEVEQALAKGTTLEQFSKQLKPALVAKGFWGKVEVTDPRTGELRTTTFNANRLATIFHTNIRQSVMRYFVALHAAKTRNRKRFA